MTATAIRAAAQAMRPQLQAHAFQPERAGRVIACEGLLLQMEGLEAPVGSLVSIALGPAAGEVVDAEVIGFRNGLLLLMALGPAPIAPGARGWLRGEADRVPVGEDLLGRVSGARGEALDEGAAFRLADSWPLGGRPLPPLDRAEVSQLFPSGVRAIDGLLTLGRGQRVGLVAGSGVGKSVLMQQLVRGSEADCVVIGLIGERGREISTFLRQLQGGALLRAHVVAVPADSAAPLRVRGVLRAFAIAEWLRSLGRHVLLVIDSLTRVAHAQREIALAAGEPPGRRGYPPSSLDLLPRLIERAGNDRMGGGAITALFTVLADGDDLVSDPVVDTARGVLDGHILLDRGIAGRGRFPAIDISQSLSRTMADCVSADHLAAANQFRRNMALVEQNRDLVAMGAYQRGQDPQLDAAMDDAAAMEAYLAQGQYESIGVADALQGLQQVWGAGMSPAQQKIRRLARLASIRQLDVRIAENRAVAARTEADIARTHTERVRAIIAESTMAQGVSTGAMLASAAGLRGLLHKALDAAIERAGEKSRLHARQVQLHARADARAEHVQDSLQHSRRLGELQAEDRDRDDHVPRRQRKDRP